MEGSNFGVGNVITQIVNYYKCICKLRLIKIVYLMHQKNNNCMKKLLLLTLSVLFGLSAYSQENSFAVLNNHLVWEDVIIAPEANIPAIITRHSKLKITSTEGNIYRGKAMGLSSSCNDSSKILKNEYNFDFEIELSEGKYRVTVTNIVFKGKRGGKADNFYIEKYPGKSVLANADADLNCLDAYFIKLFTMTTVYKTKS